jgi:hypothetical protein
MAFTETSERTRNAHVTDEPSALGGLREAEAAGPDHTPKVVGRLVRQKIPRQNNYRQAGERYRKFDWSQALEAGGVLVGEDVQVTLDLQLARKPEQSASAQ